MGCRFPGLHRKCSWTRPLALSHPRCGRSPRPCTPFSRAAPRARSRESRTSRPTCLAHQPREDPADRQARRSREPRARARSGRCLASPRTGRLIPSLELVHEFQSIETELGVPQTPIEVAMDDWALATVSDLEDRTRVRGVAGAVSSTRASRRRRVASAGCELRAGRNAASPGERGKHGDQAARAGQGDARACLECRRQRRARDRAPCDGDPRAGQVQQHWDTAGDRYRRDHQRADRSCSAGAIRESRPTTRTR